MDQVIQQTFADISFYQLAGLLTAALFFWVLGVKALRDEQIEGLLLIVIGIFFAVAHFFALAFVPSENSYATILGNLDIWKWLTMLLAPSLITLFIALGLWSMVRSQARLGLVKVFFGLTLVCYLYLIGSHWPVDVRGILTSFWGLAWFNLELATTQ